MKLTKRARKKLEKILADLERAEAGLREPDIVAPLGLPDLDELRAALDRLRLALVPDNYHDRY